MGLGLQVVAGMFGFKGAEDPCPEIEYWEVKAS